MVFSSLVFLLKFLPVTIVLYLLAPNIKIKNIVLIIASLFFYAWGEPIWVILLVFSAVVDYICGGLAGKYQNSSRGKLYLITSLVLNIGILAIFKYGNFIVDNINWLLNTQITVAEISLPIGISFYTMQTISYTIDAYRGKVRVQKSFLSFLLYVSMFPQLVAGPIVRYEVLQDQLTNRRVTLEGMYAGVVRFSIGLAKKAILANYAGSLAIEFLNGDLASQSSLGIWFGLLCFTFQIYFDFSGYSDMAIGLGKMFGFNYPENFKHPYISQSITEFWRRWHISLSSFFRDYVYIPLGGNRRYQYRNLLIVWMLTGLWHGASWNFVIWGLYFALILSLEKKFLLRFLDKIPVFLRRVYAFVFVVFGFNFFYFEDFSRNIEALKVMFGFAGVSNNIVEFAQLVVNYSPFIAICFIFAAPTREYLTNKIKNLNLSPQFIAVGASICIAILVILSTTSIVSNSYNPFIYFRF
jgi:alginate O-acetyltransferase complex protein AlgI